MLFITNREPKGSIKTRINRKFDFDLRKNAPSNSIYCCERLGPNEYIELGSEAWLNRIKDSPAQQVLFYIHGFSSLPEPDIFPRVQRLQQYFNAEDPELVQVVPVIWPCDDDPGIVKDYWDDQKSADMSAYSFSRALQRFMDWRDQQTDASTCVKRINILAHSMGSRVFRQTLAMWNMYDLANGVPLLFRNTFLVAADIVNETLEEHHVGRLMSQASRNLSVYYASDDLALRASKLSNLKNKVASRRLGHTGPENMSKVQSNVYAIDCDDINNLYDNPKGHLYFLNAHDGEPGAVFDHMLKAIKTGRVEVKDAITRHHQLLLTPAS
ncbi:alpha/beta hydrolase [Alteromonas pelagimontana]|uniref:Alpha/beta hydrolase n=1 Tax=Alteromonas pelagimontana TaxID=1858656 RepID=A0A6M4ME31_9ALTE|nr:alpha/beta hydrolase [Alteromonas pelagimontana]QJR81098.1 alpha/beta hydrolase [Alteromonas pelagimontana]